MALQNLTIISLGELDSISQSGLWKRSKQEVASFECLTNSYVIRYYRLCDCWRWLLAMYDYMCRTLPPFTCIVNWTGVKGMNDSPVNLPKDKMTPQSYHPFLYFAWTLHFYCQALYFTLGGIQGINQSIRIPSCWTTELHQSIHPNSHVNHFWGERAAYISESY